MEVVDGHCPANHYAAIRSHESAHRAQLSAHSRITASSPISRHDRSHSRQIAAQARQTWECWGDLLARNPAEVPQITAQSMSSPICAAAACFPPSSRQCGMLLRQISRQSLHALRHSRMAPDIFADEATFCFAVFSISYSEDDGLATCHAHYLLHELYQCFYSV